MKNILKYWMLVIIILMTACSPDDPDPIPIEFSQDFITLQEGMDGKVTVTKGFSPYGVQSSNTKVATVTVSDNEITISAVSTGNATIKVTGKDGGTGSISITVTADQLKTFKADATLRWEITSQPTIKNEEGKHLFYKDTGKLFSSVKMKLGYGNRSGTVLTFVEWEGSIALGGKQNPTLRRESGVIVLNSLEVIQVKDGLIWLIAKEGSKEIRIVQKW